MLQRLVLIAGLAGILWGVPGSMAAPAAVETIARNAFIVAADTGTILLEKAADVPVPPASMSKLMTAYMVFMRLKEGSLKLEDTFPVGERAWRMGGSRMFLDLDSRVTVHDLLRGIIVQSGNDACVVIAEGLAQTEEAFAAEMDAVGKKIGLTGSSFRNVSGWPAEGHVMSARDIATVSLRLIQDFPEYYGIFAEREFTYNGIRQGNRNPLLYDNVGADGLKTGHTEAAGYGLAASAKQGERRIVMVLHGMTNAKERAREAERLIDWAFREFDDFRLLEPGAVVEEAEVWLGEAARVPLTAGTPLVVTLPRTGRSEIRAKVTYDGPIPAPITKGAHIADLVISVPGTTDRTVPLYAAADVGRLGVAGRIVAALGHIVWGAADSPP